MLPSCEVMSFYCEQDILLLVPWKFQMTKQDLKISWVYCIWRYYIGLKFNDLTHLAESKWETRPHGKVRWGRVDSWLLAVSWFAQSFKADSYWLPTMLCLILLSLVRDFWRHSPEQNHRKLNWWSSTRPKNPVRTCTQFTIHVSL